MLSTGASRLELAAAAWAAFLNSSEEPYRQPCSPPFPHRNATVDFRNLSSLLRAQVAPERRRRLACEQPSELQHMLRLEAAASKRGYRLKVVQIGANEGGSEGNE